MLISIIYDNFYFGAYCQNLPCDSSSTVETTSLVFDYQGNIMLNFYINKKVNLNSEQPDINKI